MSRLIYYFKLSAGTLFLITALAKLISSFGTSRILNNPDPIFTLAFRHAFWAVGAVELVTAGVCLLGKRTAVQVGLVAWLASSFVIYRLGILWVGYQKPCACLGNLTDALHIPPQTVDTAMKIILAYLLIGSYAALFWLWRQRKKLPATVISGTSAPATSPAP